MAPDLNRTPFTADEDLVLMTAVRDLGTRWIEVARRLPGRSENACKNRYNSTLRRQANALKALIRKRSLGADLSKVSAALAKQALGPLESQAIAGAASNRVLPPPAEGALLLLLLLLIPDAPTGGNTAHAHIHSHAEGGCKQLAAP
ncbi:MAG: hypothetical protein EOO41_05690 [Methanobacteriota archaeon]|nr:MAG: hypothetical protein EOO41_05690 [Euryarchaeota archaeon]